MRLPMACLWCTCCKWLIHITQNAFGAWCTIRVSGTTAESVVSQQICLGHGYLLLEVLRKQGGRSICQCVVYFWGKYSGKKPKLAKC